MKQYSYYVRCLSVFLSVVLALLALPLTVYADAIRELAASEDAEVQEIADQDAPKKGYDNIFEDRSLREESVKHYRLPDGSYVALQYDSAVHMLDADGEWQDIDNRLLESGSEFSTDDARIKFVKKITGNETVFTLHEGNHKIEMALDGAIKKTVGEAKNTETAFDESATLLEKLTTLDHLTSQVIYRDILKDIDLQYTVDGRRIKEALIVKEPKTENSWSFTVKLNNLTAELTETGDIEITDGTAAVYRIPAPIVWDADGVYAPSDAAWYTLEAIGTNRYRLTVTVADAWMNADERAYPVTVDPTISTDENISDTYVYEAVKTASYGGLEELFVGEDSNRNEYVAFFKMLTLPTLPKAATVTSSTIRLYCSDFVTYNAPSFNVGVYESTSAFTESSTWTGLGISENEPDSALLIDYAKITASTEGTWVNWDLTELTKKWYDGGTNNGVYFRDIQSNKAKALLGSSETATKPVFEVQYRLINGIESYLTYRTQTAGLAGTSYVNMATGGLTFVFSGYSTDDGLMPYTPSLIYNTMQKGQYFNASFGNTSTVIGSGYGWKLDSQQSVVQRSYENPSGGSTYYYVFMDADGTEHAFMPYTTSSGTVYYDEDGLNLELAVLSTVTDGMQYKIKDTHGNAMGFSPNGYLVKEIDNFGNERIYTRSGARLTSVSLKPSGGSVIEQVKFHYYTGSEATVLSEIEYVGTAKRIRLYYSDTAGGVYSQDKTRYLRKVEFCRYDADTTTYTVDASVTYTYSSTTNHLSAATDTFSSYVLRYSYMGNRVTMANEYSENTLGQRVGFSYQNGITEYRTSGSDDVYNTSDDLLTTMLFDNHCRLITTYMTDIAKTVLYGSSTADYVELPEDTTTAEAAKNANKIKTAASASATSPNLVLDGGFEDTTKANWSAVQSASLSVLTGAKNHGIYGMRLSFGTGQTSAGLVQSVYLTPGTYTFSVNYRKYGNTTVSSSLSLLTPTGATVVTASDTVNFTAATPIAEGFAPLSVTFTVTSEGMYSVGVLAMRESTTYAQYFYLDDAVLVMNHGMGTPSMLENGGFEAGANAGWERTLPLTSSETHTGRYALVLTSGLNDFITEGQTVALLTNDRITAIQSSANYAPNTENKSYVLSGWAKADAVKQNEDRLFGVLVFVNYVLPGSDTLTFDMLFMPFNADTGEWQYGSLAIITDPAKGYPASIEVYCQYSYNNGSAYFDDLVLTESTDTVDYVYDAKGRVTKTLNGNGYDSTAVTYYDEADPDAGGEIETVTYADGRVIEYGYMNHRQAYHYVSDADGEFVEGALSMFDAYGNVIETFSESADTDYMRSAYTYSTDNAIFGRVLTAEDATGLVTKYHYDGTTHYLVAVTTSDGVGTVYTYDALGRQISARPALVSNDSYTAETGAEQAIFAYDGNLLASITTGSTTYNFSYDGYHNRKSVAVGSSQIAYYIYNNYNGKLIYTVYANGYVTKNVYDALDRVSEVWYTQITGSLPTSDSAYDGYTYSLKESYCYDEKGLVSAIVDHLANTKTVYSYDTEGKPTQVVRFDKNGGLTAEFYEKVAYNSVGLVSTGVDGYALNGTKYTDRYTYAYDALQRLSVMYYGYSGSANRYTYAYDGLSRVTNRTLTYGGLTVSQNYTYARGQGSFGESETGRVEVIRTTIGSTTTSQTFLYDARGNITKIYIDGVVKYSYVYDNLNQLTRENNAVANKTYLYTYDDAGNILTKRTYAYTTGTLGSVQSTNTYTYGNSSWGDQLTAFNGTSITYDALGNPKSYYNGSNYTFAWAKGRQLSAVLHNNKTTTFTYNADGIRTKKVGTTTVEYILNGTQIVAEMNGSNVIRYVYDAQGLPVAMILNGTTYLYEKNLQGDVIGIYNTSGTKVASYSYDAWGNLISSSYSDYSAYTYNPFRYRGYYYDRETGFYYLQSRYYDPATGRFLNADGYINGNGDIVGFNMYAYCGNNPIMCVDYSGKGWFSELLGAVSSVFVPFLTNVTNHIVNLFITPDDELKDSYTIAEAESEINGIVSKYSADNDMVVASFQPKPEDKDWEYVHITNSWRVDSREDRLKVCEIISRTVDENGNPWTSRETDNMASEWLAHNIAYNYGYEVDRSRDVDIDQGTDWSSALDFITKFLEFMGWE